MPRKAHNLFSTARGRVRASMNKVNLFNLYKKNPTDFKSMTLYQQKWRAKQETRAYHGEHLKESRWKALFKPRLDSVAQLDASLKGMTVDSTPLTLQTYAVLEKRLETALFRSMFASSIRQARQFIQSGDVKVNGIIIRHPAFPLRSGDIFSVNPERVLFALGKSKPSVEEAVKIDNKQIGAWNMFVKNVKKNPEAMWNLKKAKPPSLDPFKEEARLLYIKNANSNNTQSMLKSQKMTTRESILLRILQSAAERDVTELSPSTFKEIAVNSNTDQEKCLQVYSMMKSADYPLEAQSSPADVEAYINTKSLEFANPEDAKIASRVKKILGELVSLQVEGIRVTSKKSMLENNQMFASCVPELGNKLRTLPINDLEKVKEDESNAVKFKWQRHLFGRKDPSKIYFTPWKPKAFLGAFAILPHHIEVCFDTCHAVYLNDPVARPGYSEVISPFPVNLHERAYMYYVRKGM